jgi:hypothetical protein
MTRNPFFWSNQIHPSFMLYGLFSWPFSPVGHEGVCGFFCFFFLTLTNKKTLREPIFLFNISQFYYFHVLSKLCHFILSWGRFVNYIKIARMCFWVLFSLWLIFFIVLRPVTHCFCHQGLVVCLHVWQDYPPLFVFQADGAILGPLFLHVNFRISLSNLLKILLKF